MVIFLNFCTFLLQIALSVLPMFALNPKGMGTYLCAHELHHLLVTARRSPGCLFVHVTLSLIPFFLPSFLPNTENQTSNNSNQKATFKSSKVFSTYTPDFWSVVSSTTVRSLLPQKQKMKLIEQPPKKAVPLSIYPSETHRFLYNWPQNIMCTLNWMLIFTFPLFIWHLHFVFPRERFRIQVILQSQNVAVSFYFHILSWHKQMASGGEWRE